MFTYLRSLMNIFSVYHFWLLQQHSIEIVDLSRFNLIKKHESRFVAYIIKYKMQFTIS